MINFKYFATKAAYTGATVASDSICFVADEKTIYTHGVAFNGQGSIDLSAYIKGVTASGVLTASKSSQTVTLTHNTSTLTGGTYGPAADVTGNEGNTIVIPQITTDNYGHITGITTRTYTSKNTTYTSNVSKTGAATANYIPVWNADSAAGSAGVLKGGYSVDSSLGTATTAIPTSKAVSDAISAASENTATLQIGSAADKKINTEETTGSYIQFTGGTNKFTVSDGATSFEVAVTPSIANNVTGTGLTSGNIVLGNGSSSVKGSTYSITNASGASGAGQIMTADAIQSAISGAVDALPEPMVFQGGTAALPSTAATGATYKVITNNISIPAASSDTGSAVTAKVGDTIIRSAAGKWTVIPSGDEPSGTVTSVGISAGNTALTVSGGPISTSGTLTVSHADIETTTAISTAALAKITTDGLGHIKTAAGATKADITGLLGNYVTSVNGSTGDVTVQATISDLATIRSNASAGASAATTIAGYGDIVTHDADEFMPADTTIPQGTVTSITIKGGTGITSSSDAAITTSGTRTLTLATYGTAGTYGNTTATLTNGGTFALPRITTDAYGRVTVTSSTMTLPSYSIPTISATSSGSGTVTIGSVTINGTTTTFKAPANTNTYVNSATFAANTLTLGRTGDISTDLTATMPIATTQANGAMSSAMVGQLNYITGSTTATVASSTLTINAVNRLNYYEPTGNPTVTLAVPAAANWVGPEYHLIIKGAATLKIPTTLNSSPVYYNGDLLAATGTMVCDVTEEVSIIKAGSAYYVRTSTWSIE